MSANKLTGDYFDFIFKYLDISSICCLLQTNKEFINLNNH